MATFRNRHGKWQARVQHKGQQRITKSFQSKEDSQRWARQIESEIDKGAYTNIVLAERTLFKDVIERYVQEVTLKTRSMKEDTYRLRALSRHPIAKFRMTALTPIKVAEYRDERLQIVSNGAVIRELSYFSSIINHARREWGITMVNPIPLVKKPASPQGRNRLLSEEELSRLYEALTPKIKSSNHWILPLTKFALETAMRRGEILGLYWEHINLVKRTAFISLTKNGESRLVPLSTAAIEILRGLPRNLNGQVFPVKGTTLSAAIEKARTKAGVRDFHFHDLRHMAITRLAKKLPNLIELSAVSGHKSLAMLKRYYHPNPEQYLVTAGGKIRCRRCKAQSSRTKLQCAKPALKDKVVCGHHGGYSTGPRTQEGKERIRAAHFKHGEETLEAKAERSAKSVMFRYLTDLGNHCNMFYKQLKTRGRPPSGYAQLDLTDPEQLAFAILKT